MIRATGVTKTYGSGDTAVTAVRDVTLDVASGEVLLILGPNGSGKTTLLAMLGCMLRPTSGTIAIDGQPVNTLTNRQLADLRLRRIGFVFQSFRLLDALSARDNIALLLQLAGAPLARADELLARVGMSHRASLRADALSGGEKQRIAIARAIANDPPILLADEPTGSLDSVAGEQIVKMLVAQAHEERKAVVIVSHDTRIEAYADRVVRMGDGELSSSA
jgi:putative ABC transport system ATP-binding protein